ncbi:MAG: tyrosine-type recombinase/integrase [Bacteroidota bacterium]
MHLLFSFRCDLLHGFLEKTKTAHAQALGKRYSATNVLKIVKTAARKANIRARVTPHMLRHSMATHLLKDSTDLRQIQTLLDHNLLKTTEIDTHVAVKGLNQIKNPLDLVMMEGI